MSDKPIILAGLALFLAVVTFPVWYMLLAAGEIAPPAREYPADGPRCVEQKEWMVANHMTLLRTWRNDVVRDADKSPYKSEDFGTEHTKSLTGTCMGCHSKPEMCDRDGRTACRQCHDYAGVEPDCWDCHIELKGN